ncbi:hypothetical protein HMPREF0995_04075 [Lachnospiraceae bacterium 7_1_58FAA]|jgi:kilA domain protein|uniref:KilA-N domain-containing protein n=1 Tax=Flavonifractor plautii TaxID=292800 RepID=A0AAW6CF35_FLAPL|nr:KilA-N domain-containing protein [Flavonifractor plautii]EHO30201.1 hypothetical protein HMPREF0995_04075 [Lachnospiraceae bacterium 7_1_58FAA]MCB6875420.1 KilA-N domain-containing protein [Flavonifractor plautii]MCB7361730.1 KilA-N domain-containing protein [Flavonifractor plautii]MCQ4661689.1 KilA-N domain-containing protein [Flavonifractor plautii]MCQ4687231.1 KilA-N domain-containing protein [Flavonifractor plautii]
MDAEKVTKNHVSYIYSKEIILKNLLQQGIISNQDFDRYDQMLYDRYHMDSSLGISRPIISSQSAELPDADQSDFTYLSLTDEARSVNQDQPGYVIQSWLRDRTTISFLHYWETQNNENFDAAGYKALEEELKSPTLTLTAKKWIEATRAIGLRSKQGKNGGTYAHPEIACVFRAWLHPEYQYTLVQSFLHDRKRKAGRDEQA